MTPTLTEFHNREYNTRLKRISDPFCLISKSSDCLAAWVSCLGTECGGPNRLHLSTPVKTQRGRPKLVSQTLRMGHVTLSSCLLLAFSLVVICLTGTVLSSHTDVVLLGGTGDLAQKYLWRSFFDLFSKYSERNSTFSFYGCGRRRQDEGRAILSSILETSLTCSVEDKKCHENRKIFRDLITYHSLETEQDFEDLGKLIGRRGDGNTEAETPSKPNGVIFYAAIPPNAYSAISEGLRRHCYPRTNGTWVRLVLEKPFGSNSSTAAEIVDNIARHFREDEIFRIDHYLGKSVVRQILPFRIHNRDVLENMLNKEHVERVEVAMKETLGVEDRIEFYDEIGVIRDVFQNHLTELLTLIAMDLPVSSSPPSDLRASKIRLLERIRSVKRESLLIGQYSGYLDEARVEKENISKSIHTPTFSAALLHVDNIRWWGVPFLLYSGKRLDKKSSYIRIVFRDNIVCVSKCNFQNSSQSTGRKQIVFQVGGGDLPHPGILVSESLFNPAWSPAMRPITVTSQTDVNGLSSRDFYYAVPSEDLDAYTTLIDDIYKGDRNNFVGTNQLMKSWDIWNDILEQIKGDSPRVYDIEKGKYPDFTFKGEILEFENEFKGNQYRTVSVKEDQVETFIPATYLDQALVFGDDTMIIRALSSRILNSTTTAINERGVFHIALSGGKSPIKLFNHMAETFPPYVWTLVHIWQVDERCVRADADESNFRILQEELFNKIRIPYLNIHPMPVEIAGRICQLSDNGEDLYENIVRHKIPSLRMDHIVLGLGTDAHVASIFPFSGAINEERKLVLYTETTGVTPIHRMSILFPLINRAREVSILVSGRSKHEILQSLESEDSEKNLHPVRGVRPSEGNVSWYIDRAAWFGV
ncbi:hypothetical protein ScPMuIL_016320 [Solemya velum]